MRKSVTCFLLIALFIQIIVQTLSSCANIIPPSGGPRDSLPPKLINAFPKDSAVNVTTKNITLNFDEFVDVKSIQENLVVSPITKNLPLIDYRLRSVTVKFKDSLEPNTTYSLDFGDAIKDVNEGNILKNFTYVFSTGKNIANGTFSGNVLIAETGKIDSALIVVLHQNLNDTAILKDKPRYFAKLNGKGNFRFKNVEPGKYAAFVLPNNYSKKFEDSTLPFAFLNTTIVVTDTTASANFYAYKEKKAKDAGSFGGAIVNTVGSKPNAAKEDKRLKYTNSFEGIFQDLVRNNIVLSFNRPLVQFDSSKILLCDTLNKPLANYRVMLDSTKKIISVVNNIAWKESMPMHLLVLKEAFADSSGITLTKSDTLQFITKKEAEYGSVKLRFSTLDLSKHPVLQFIQADKITESVTLTSKDFYRKLFKPGDYELRVLFDNNRNGIWDSGNYKKKLQPEIVFVLKQTFTFKSNWDNEVDNIVVP